MPSVEIKIVTAVVIFISICSLPALSKVLPNVLACILRWKESVNVQMSSARHDRNMAAWGILPLFILICTAGKLLPHTLNMGFLRSFGYTAAVFIAYCLVRSLFSLIFRSRKIGNEKYSFAISSQYNFFIIATIVMTLTCTIYLLFNVTSLLSNVLLWELAAVYLIFLIRKTQIFTYYEGFFSGILYLCTLEILPTSLLVVSIWLL